ncbi:hypothetical protein J6590_071213 [Homalodisca vitripennis]|nr:hypothetical protein J6590_071213 [Homalodisca vitripennis]
MKGRKMKEFKCIDWKRVMPEVGDQEFRMLIIRVDESGGLENKKTDLRIKTVRKTDQTERVTVTTESDAGEAADTNLSETGQSPGTPSDCGRPKHSPPRPFNGTVASALLYFLFPNNNLSSSPGHTGTSLITGIRIHVYTFQLGTELITQELIFIITTQETIFFFA